MDERVCMFCGKSIPLRYDESTPYYECGCPDAVKDRQIQEQIRLLVSKRPSHKYMYVRQLVKIHNKEAQDG